MDASFDFFEVHILGFQVKEHNNRSAMNTKGFWEDLETRKN